MNFGFNKQYSNKLKIEQIKSAIIQNKQKYNDNIQKFKNIDLDTRKKIESIILKAKDIISNELLPIIKSTNELLEGNIFMFHHTTNYTNEFFEKQVNFVLLAQEPNINSILEIGFNAGFSTLLMLLTNDKVKITCVDICEHKYTKPCYNKLKEMFGDRITLIPGSSVTIVPTLIENIYDMIHIDGCHLENIAELDIQNSLRLCKSGTILIMDDTNGEVLYNLWMKYVKLYNLLNSNKFINSIYHNIKIYP
jgi:predicted O-methyltransferase YrrM